jgi:hypothetical protein
LPLCRFSRPVLSTAQPSLREQGFINKIILFNKIMIHIIINLIIHYFYGRI